MSMLGYLLDRMQGYVPYESVEEPEVAQLSISKKIKLFTNYIDDNALLVNCNPEEIKQVLIHMLLNAKDALENSQKKEMHVTFECKTRLMCEECDHCESTATQVIHLIVEDSGCGISKKAMKRIYDPFFSTKEVGQGKGLGLSMAKGVVESHGGVIHITSTEKVGTKVSICLPLVVCP